MYRVPVMKITVIMTNGRLVTVCAVCTRRLPIYNKGIFFSYLLHVVYSSGNNNNIIHMRTLAQCCSATKYYTEKSTKKNHYWHLPSDNNDDTII